MAFAGKVILITGASSGIGASTAIHLSNLGASLALVGRNEINLNEVKKQSTVKGQPIPLTILADVTTDSSRIINETISHFGHLDVLVNNAGIGDISTVETSSIDDFDKILNTNVRSVYQLTKLAIPYLLKTKGNIVNVSSVAGLRAYTNSLNYCMSKGALDQFTKCCALDFAPLGVRVNSVNPAVIETNFFKTLGINDADYVKFLERAKEVHPIGRAGVPEEVAVAIAFLAADSASFITGTLLTIDGGKSITCPK